MKRIQHRFWATIVLFCILCSTAQSSVVVYPTDGKSVASPHYQIEIEQNGELYRPFTYCSEAQVPEYNLSKTTSWCSFAFTGKIKIRITPVGFNPKQCLIRPQSYGLAYTIENNTFVIEIDRPRKISIEFDNSVEHALLLFADAPETDIPDKSDKHLIYYEPGFHSMAEPLKVAPNQKVYLAPGAYVEGLIYGNNTPNVKIFGRGILSGRKYGHTGGRHIYFTGASENVTVKDITIVDAPGFFVTTQSANTHISNIKGMGWWFNTDGISTGENGLIEDCFLKCNDDAIKLYSSGTKVYNTTIWQMENGAPFQISWNMNSNNSGFVAKNCDVIRVDHIWDNPNEAVFDAIHGGKGNMSNYLFEDIRIEQAPWRLVSLQVRFNKFAKSNTLGTISNIIFRNISVRTKDNKPMQRVNLIQGYDETSTISNITFENLTINGQFIGSAKEGNFEIDPRTTSDITFKTTVQTKNTPAKTKLTTPAEWTNPIKNGLNTYGQKDFHVVREGNTWYMVATEYPNPEWGRRGIVLYASTDMVNWRETCYLINRNTLIPDTWYRDGWLAPEINKVGTKYVLTFHGYNESINPYSKTGLCIAIADKIEGPYTVISDKKPVMEANNTTIFTTKDGRTIAFWDLDGTIYSASIDLTKAQLLNEPAIAVQLKGKSGAIKIADAPTVFEHKGKYFMLYTVFSGGYVLRTCIATASSPNGPWQREDEPLMTFTEDDAPDKTTMPYSVSDPFAPPTQVILHTQALKMPDNKLMLIWNSSEKYSEPFMMMSPLIFDKNNRVSVPQYKNKIQHAQ